MASMIKITGVSRVLSRLKKVSQDYEKDVPRKLGEGGLFVQREAQLLTPVKRGFLKANVETRNVGGSGFDADVAVMFFQDYAVYVHENMEAHHTVGEAKFLEKPAKEKRDEILKIIANA